MLELIYSMQAKLAADGTSIDNVLLWAIALFILMTVGYLVECELSKGEGQ